MKRTGFLIFFILLSFLFHLFSLFFFKVEIDAKNTPVVYSWPNIVNKNDLLASQSAQSSAPEVVFPLDTLRREYFAKDLSAFDALNSFESQAIVFDKKTKTSDYPEIAAVPKDDGPRYFFLWDEVSGLSSNQAETVTYNMYISPQGKVLFIYPDTLPANSSGNLQVQDYLRSASIFMNNNFFWTKMERIVK